MVFKVFDVKIEYDETGQVCFCKQRKLFNCQNRQINCPLAVLYMMQKHNIWPFPIERKKNE